MIQFRRAAGFTLIELTVVIAIIVALAAVVIPMVGQAKRDGQVSAILKLVESLRTAAMKHHSDTGRIAREDGSKRGPNQHHLAIRQTTTGWSGPYIDHALTDGDNPYGGTVIVFDSLDQANQGGFDLLGRGSNSATGPGNFLRLTNVPEDIGRLVNDALDQGVPGNWRQRGRVQFRDGNLDVFLFDVDGQ